jgi:hypothetical protein
MLCHKKIKELPPLLIAKILRNSHASGQINYIKQYVIKNLLLLDIIKCLKIFKFHFFSYFF